MSVSDNYFEISYEEWLSEEIQDAVAGKNVWEHPKVVDGQRELSSRELERFRAGERVAPFNGLCDLLDEISGQFANVLEVGCGCGYYADVLAHRFPEVRYHGIDKSKRMIETASTYTANGVFFQEDVRQGLMNRYGTYDLVIEGCSISQTIGWQTILRECVKLSRRWVVLHRTPFSTSGETRYWRKDAYGIATREVHFSESVSSTMTKAGCAMVNTVKISEAPEYAVTSSLWRKM